MIHRNGLSHDEIVNVLRELSDDESDGAEPPSSNGFRVNGTTAGAYVGGERLRDFERRFCLDVGNSTKWKQMPWVIK
ncbi:hypothetical protein TNCV_3540491 [Trichonephila clavipes]|nr:hypothetical protein TNCV_3540491 [Trichonephila clavipes]